MIALCSWNYHGCYFLFLVRFVVRLTHRVRCVERIVNDVMAYGHGGHVHYRRESNYHFSAAPKKLITSFGNMY